MQKFAAGMVALRKVWDIAPAKKSPIFLRDDVIPEVSRSI